MDWPLLLFILKFCSVSLVGLLALWGMLFETKVEYTECDASGKSVTKSKLSKKGRIAFLITAVSSLVTLLILAAEEMHSRNEGMKKAEESLKLLAQLKEQNEGLRAQSTQIKSVLETQQYQNEQMQQESFQNSERAQKLFVKLQLQTENTFKLMEEMQVQTKFAQQEANANALRSQNQLDILAAQGTTMLELLQAASRQESLAIQSVESVRQIVDRFHFVNISVLLELKDSKSKKISALKEILQKTVTRQRLVKNKVYSVPRQVGAQSFTQEASLRWVGWDLTEERPPGTKEYDNLFGLIDSNLVFAFSKDGLSYKFEPEGDEFSLSLGGAQGEDADILGLESLPCARVCLRYDCEEDRLYVLYTGFLFDYSKLKTSGRIVGLSDLAGANGVIVLVGVFPSAFEQSVGFYPVAVKVQIDQEDIYFANFKHPPENTPNVSMWFQLPSDLRRIVYTKEESAQINKLLLYKEGTDGNILTRPRLTFWEALRINLSDRYRRQYEERLDPSLNEPKTFN